MTRLSIAQELERTADRIADHPQADLRTILRRAALMLRNVAGISLDTSVQDATNLLAAEMRISQTDLIRIILRPSADNASQGYPIMDVADNRAAELAELTADGVSAFVRNNSVPVAGLADLIASVHRSLSDLGEPVAAPAKEFVPVNPKKSVTPDFIICLEDGKQFKSLKRHIRTQYNLTPDAYRAKWGLPADYPMVAPSYSIRRSEMARSFGLGRKAEAEAPVVEKAPSKRKTKASTQP
jgi:predicted transcriptional regulator